MARARSVVFLVLLVAAAASWLFTGRTRGGTSSELDVRDRKTPPRQRVVRPDEPQGNRASRGAPLPVLRPRVEPVRFPSPVEHGLSAESKRLWLDETSSQHDIELAHALDVCACPDLDCVRALEATLYARFAQAPSEPVDPRDAEAVRRMDTECAAALGRQAQKPSDGSAERLLSALIR
jgi:hypothetical protein